MDVQLVSVSAANIDGINALRLAADQMHGMAYPAYATWQGFFEAPAMRTFAFEASGGVVGFAQISVGDGNAFFYVERFAVGAGFQGRGVGRACFGRLLGELRALKDKDKERGSVRLAYAAPTADFCPPASTAVWASDTGEIEDAGGDEQMVVMELALDAGSDAGSDAADAPCPLAASNTVFRLIPEGERFAAIPSLPLSIQACDLALMDPQNAHIRAFYFGNSLGPMCLSNARWLNWAIYQPPGSVTLKIMFSSDYLNSANDSQSTPPPQPQPKPVGYVIIQHKNSRSLLKHIFVNPCVRGRGLAKRALQLVDLSLTVASSDVYQSQASLGLAHLDDEENGPIAVDIRPVLVKLGFSVADSGDYEL